MTSHITKFRKYVKDVESGTLPAPMYVQQAVARHIRDLKDKRFVFDVAAATRPCQFLELLPHVKGKWARNGETLKLETWQVFIIGSIFGWKNKRTGLRRFNNVYIEVPRKNGKSFLASGIAIYMLVADGESGSEVYTAGKTRDQAKLVFDVASQMLIKLGKVSQECLGLKVEVHRIKELRQFGIFEPLASESKSLDGKNPHCAIIDEVHAHTDGQVYDSLALGMSSREQPLMFSITTAGTHKDGLCWNLRNQAIRMLNQTKGFEDDSSFGIIWAANPDEDTSSEKVWRKVNPNFDVSIIAENFRASYHTAATDPAALTAWLTKKLNIWTNTSSPWLKVGAWESVADSKITPEQFADDPEWTSVIGVDLSARIDLSAVALVFYRGRRSLPNKLLKDEDNEKFIPTDNEYVVFTRVFVPESRAIERASDGYGEWKRKDSIADLVVCKGKSIDYIEIEDTIMDWHDRFGVHQVGVDPWQAAQTMKRLENHGITCVTVGQTTKNLSPAMREVEAALYANRLKHTGDPCLQWCAEAVECKVSENGSIYPRKANKNNPRIRIDAAMAMFIAFSQIITGLYVPEDTSWDPGNIMGILAGEPSPEQRH